MPVYEGCRLEDVRVIDVRHEHPASHAAEAGVGRINRACGVALVTAGPGVTGTVTAVANCPDGADAARRPRRGCPVAQAEQGALQEFTQLSLFKPITKWAASCSSFPTASPTTLPRRFARHSRTSAGAGLPRAADGRALLGRGRRARGPSLLLPRARAFGRPRAK